MNLLSNQIALGFIIYIIFAIAICIPLGVFFIFTYLFLYTFLAIPIYKGSSIIKEYINENRFIDLYDPIENIIEKIKLYNTNEQIYNEIISYNIISNKYNNENYENRLTDFIDNKLSNIKNRL